MQEHILLTAFIAGGCIILFYTAKKLKTGFFLLSAFCGAAALIAADLVSGLLGLQVPLNAFTFSVAAVGGIPGVILLNVLRVFFA